MSNDLVVRTDYAALTASESIREVIEANVGRGGLSRFDLDRVRIPAGGGTSWLVPTLTGEENVAELRGIIVGWRDGRVYWKRSLGEGEQTPPDCSSEDAVTGVGDPGGRCAKCPYAAWGTAKDGAGRGQACKLLRVLLVLRPTDMLPMVVALPPTSVGPMRKYLMRLSSKSMPFFAVETVFTLERTKNAVGIAYSRVVPTVGRVLEAEALENLTTYKDQIKGALESVRVEADDYVEKETA